MPPAKPYTLTMGPPETANVGRWGEFTLIRPFVVGGEEANGFIVQRIERTATVTVHDDGRVLKTSGEISSFTGGNVANTVDTYYELFVVENGEALDRDQFQSGAVLHYDEAGFADDDPPTSGTLKIVGTSVFVSAPAADIARAKDAMERAESAGATRASTRVKALGVDWDAFKETPANGLLYAKNAATALGLGESNQLKRTCAITWGEDGKSRLVETTVPASDEVNVAAAGGNRSTPGRSASKSSRKRRTGRARRRSSRQARGQRYRTARHGSGMSR
jgi:hypothetical protein